MQVNQQLKKRKTDNIFIPQNLQCTKKAITYDFKNCIFSKRYETQKYKKY